MSARNSVKMPESFCRSKYTLSSNVNQQLLFTARLNGIRLDFKAAKIIPLSCFSKRGFLNHSKKSQWCLYRALGKLIESAESPSRKQSITPIARNIKSIFKPPRLNVQGKKTLDMLGITFWACNTERIKDFRVKLLRVGTSYYIW